MTDNRSDQVPQHVLDALDRMIENPLKGLTPEPIEMLEVKHRLLVESNLEAKRKRDDPRYKGFVD